MRSLKSYLSIALTFLFVSCFSQSIQAQKACNWQPLSVDNVSKIEPLNELNTRQADIVSSSALSNIEISPSGSYLATSYHDSAAFDKQADMVQIWKMDGSKLLGEFTQPDDGVHFLFSPDERFLVAAGFSSVSIRDVASGLEAHRWDNYPTLLNDTNFSSDGRLLALANLQTGDITFWDMKTNSEFSHIEQPNVATIAFAPNNQQVAISTQHGSIDLWNIASNGVGKPVTIYQGNYISALTFNSTGTDLLFVDAQTIGILNLSTHDLTKLDFDATNTYLLRRAFSNIVAFSDRGVSRLRSVNSNEVLAELQGQLLLAINSDETIYASRSDNFATDESVVELRNVRSGGVLDEMARWSFTSTQGNIGLVTFSPDNHYLVTASVEGIVKLWGVAEPSNCS